MKYLIAFGKAAVMCAACALFMLAIEVATRFVDNIIPQQHSNTIKFTLATVFAIVGILYTTTSFLPEKE
jgi:hypothetical protein